MMDGIPLIQRTTLPHGGHVLSLAVLLPTLLAGSASAALPDPMPVNQWVPLPTRTNGFKRQEHAGVAYDNRRQKLLVFGSDTHGRNWDNSVWAYDIRSGNWQRLDAPPSRPASYRVTPEGIPVAGNPAAPRPWAMHTYDGLVYDPKNDELLVAAAPHHNPKRKQLKPRLNPIWRFDLITLRWRYESRRASGMPDFFDAAAAWDSHRNIPVLYKYGLWEAVSEGIWRKVENRHAHVSHYTMVHDPRRQQLAVFGNFRLTNHVWIYHPGTEAGQAGHWEQRRPGGDPCPDDQHIPVAFDRRNGVYVLVVDDNEVRVKPNGARKLIRKPRRSLTLVYDPDANRYLRLPKADLPPQRMNYMMRYAPDLDAILLVTGDGKHPVQVQALRLDLSHALANP